MQHMNIHASLRATEIQKKFKEHNCYCKMPNENITLVFFEFFFISVACKLAEYIGMYVCMEIVVYCLSNSVCCALCS